jgi:hypothetical protein
MIHLPKSQPAPISLASKKSYRELDVIERLHSDFKNKCYICEEKEITTLNVEHFISHRNNIDLKFDWNNLFFSCGHCNNTKLAKTEYDNILNCTDSKDDPESWIEYEMKPFPKEKVNLKSAQGFESNERVANTIKLLDSVYNGTTPLKLIESSNLRNKLLSEIKDFQKYLLEYYEDISEQDKITCKKKIQNHLKSSSAFTAFKRRIIKNNMELQKEFSW